MQSITQAGWYHSKSVEEMKVRDNVNVYFSIKPFESQLQRGRRCLKQCLFIKKDARKWDRDRSFALPCLASVTGKSRGDTEWEKSIGKSTAVLTVKNGQIWANPQTTVAFARAIEPNKMRRGSWGQTTKHVTPSPERHHKKKKAEE